MMHQFKRVHFLVIGDTAPAISLVVVEAEPKSCPLVANLGNCLQMWNKVG